MPAFISQPDPDPRILEALEAKPTPAIPFDFAARMATLARTESPRLSTPAADLAVPSRTPHYGRTAAWISLILLAAAILFLTPATLSTQSLHTPNPLLVVQAVLLLQLLALGLWLSSRLFPDHA